MSSVADIVSNLLRRVTLPAAVATPVSSNKRKERPSEPDSSAPTPRAQDALPSSDPLPQWATTDHTCSSCKVRPRRGAERALCAYLPGLAVLCYAELTLIAATGPPHGYTHAFV